MNKNEKNTDIDALITNAVEEELSIHQLMETVNHLQNPSNDANTEQLQLEFDLAQQAQHLLQSSPLMMATDDLEKRILRRIKRSRRHTKYEQLTPDYFAALYVVAILILMILSIFQLYVHQQSQAHYQTPLRPLIHSHLPNHKE